MSIEFHRRMLADRVRHDAFRQALARVIRPGRTTVTDIGAGTGILAFFARELGAKDVWLYEPGDVLELAEQLAERNGVDRLHFVRAWSAEVEPESAVDVVVAEVLGNFAYEEGVLETLRDAWRFLKPGGTLIPHSLEQHVAPVTTDRFDRELRSWRSVGHGLDLADAERMSLNNMYVFALEPADFLADAVRSWDALVFTDDIESLRRGTASWTLSRDAQIFGFGLWWTCVLLPGVELTTSPYAPRTHWDQIYLPLTEPVEARTGDALVLDIETETGGEQSGIAVRWTATQRRGDVGIGAQTLDIGAGHLG